MSKHKKQTKKSVAEESIPKSGRAKKASTNRPKDAVKSKAGKASAAARKAKREKGDPVSRPCSARRTNGEPCKNSAIRGGVVCSRHGGSAPQVRAKANQRLVEMVLPAMKELRGILDSKDTADADKLKAIRMVLGFAGYSERHQIDLGLRQETAFDRLMEGSAIVIQRGESLREELERMGPHPELTTRGQPFDGVGDDELEAFLEHRERARAREASTHLNNAGHEVVAGSVQPGSDDRPQRRDSAQSYEDRLRVRVDGSEGR